MLEFRVIKKLTSQAHHPTHAEGLCWSLFRDSLTTRCEGQNPYCRASRCMVTLSAICSVEGNLCYFYTASFLVCTVWFGLVWFCICFCFQFNSDPELLACLLNRIFCMLEMQGIITGYGACWSWWSTCVSVPKPNVFHTSKRGWKVGWTWVSDWLTGWLQIES